jgi:eukaryotic-like serine/threonine-protein kinase
MPDTRVRKVTIFVSSPKDVAPDRGRVQAVAAKVNREYEGLVRFETVLWEEHFYTADKSFQPQIPEAVASDIVVSIFWTRIGTELPAEFPRMENGKPYPSGTAYELLTALEASKAGSVPDVYVFRKTADAILPMADAERRRQAQTQLDALEAFWSECPTASVAVPTATSRGPSSGISTAAAFRCTTAAKRHGPITTFPNRRA